MEEVRKATKLLFQKTHNGICRSSKNNKIIETKAYTSNTVTMSGYGGKCLKFSCLYNCWNESWKTRKTHQLRESVMVLFDLRDTSQWSERGRGSICIFKALNFKKNCFKFLNKILFLSFSSYFLPSKSSHIPFLVLLQIQGLLFLILLWVCVCVLKDINTTCSVCVMLLVCMFQGWPFAIG